MNNDTRRILFVAILALFCFINLSAQFLHQEETYQPLDNCPICVWQMNAVAMATLYFLVMTLIFIVVRFLVLQDSFISFETKFVHFSRRAPPSFQ